MLKSRLTASIRRYSSVSFSLFKKNDFQNLIIDLKSVLSSVETRDQVDVRTTMNLLRLYQSDESQWLKYALRDPERSYTRNLVSQVSPLSELLVLVWQPGRTSRIHDHPNSNCFVKVLKGTLHESQFEKSKDSNFLELRRKIEVPQDAVTFISDDIGLHQMENQTNEMVVTLHLYVPAYRTCSTFESNGEANPNNDLDYYSIDGKVLKKTP